MVSKYLRKSVDPIEGSADTRNHEREHIEKRHDARTADMRVIERRKKPRQTRAQFLDHVREHCERKYGKA